MALLNACFHSHTCVPVFNQLNKMKIQNQISRTKKDFLFRPNLNDSKRFYQITNKYHMLNIHKVYFVRWLEGWRIKIIKYLIVLTNNHSFSNSNSINFTLKLFQWNRWIIVFAALKPIYYPLRLKCDLFEGVYIMNIDSFERTTE